jgi:ABC-type Mn2+/Zn2+ transport system ATPase subunit
MTNPIARFENVSASYGRISALENVNFELGANEFVGVVGPSGSGKTTLLRVLLGIIHPSAGEVVRQHGLRLGYVPQVESVDWNFPVTVAEVVGMSRVDNRWWPRTSTAERREIDDVLDQLGLAGLGGRHIRELSGGQQQRVFIARALFHRPNLLVLDEPTSGVDVSTRHEVLHLLVDLHESGVAIILSTHDLNGLAAHLPRIICVNKEVIADGAPSEVLTSEVLERTYGAPMQVLEHGGMPIVVDQLEHAISHRLRGATK